MLAVCAISGSFYYMLCVGGKYFKIQSVNVEVRRDKKDTAIVVHCRQLSSIVIHCCPMLFIVVHCRPLSFIVVHCCPLLSIVVHCCTTQPRSAMIYILHHKLPTDDTLSKAHTHLYILNFMALVLMVHFWYWVLMVLKVLTALSLMLMILAQSYHIFTGFWGYLQSKKSTDWLTDLLNNFDLRDGSASKKPEL